MRAAIEPLLAKVATQPHVAEVISPYTARGSLQISADRRTAFATVDYDKRANLLPSDTGQPLLDEVNAVHMPGLRVTAGGQVIEAAEGFSVGPATAVGAIAALVILLLTFGSLTAAGMPLITAGFGLVTGVALIGLATHVTPLSNISPQLALMIGLGVGVDYALFIVTRFRETYLELGDVDRSVLVAMDTSGRAILLAGTTVVIAPAGHVRHRRRVHVWAGHCLGARRLLTLVASLTLLPAILSRFGTRLLRPRSERRLRLRRRGGRTAGAVVESSASLAPTPAHGSAWRRWSEIVQKRPWPLAIVSLAVMVALVIPAFALRLDASDAGNDPSNLSSRHAFDMLAQGFGPGFDGPLAIVVEVPGREQPAALRAIRAAVAATPDVGAVTQPQLAPTASVAVMQAYPDSAPQAPATTALVHKLRDHVLPPLEHQTGATVLVGGFTAGSIDFSSVLGSKLPLFIGIVVLLSAVLLLIIFRSLVIPVQAAAMNLLSIGAAVGATVAVFQWGWFSSLIGVEKGPIEPWIPVLIFAVVFGLSMDYEVFLVSRVREQWVRKRDASAAVADGIAFTGRVITAAAAIMVCVFLSFMLGNQRTIKEFGFGLAFAVLVDALVVRCVLLPAVLELLGPTTWRFPRRLDATLPHLPIEGSTAPPPPSGYAAG